MSIRLVHRHSSRAGNVFGIGWVKVYCTSVFVSGLVLGGPAQALDYRTAIQVNAGADYDSNRFLGLSDNAEVTRFVLSPTWTQRWLDSVTQIDFRNSASIFQSLDDDVEQDRVDFNSELSYDRRLPTGQWGLAGNIRRRNLLDAQREDAGVDGTDSLIWTYGASGQWSKSLSQLTSINASAGVSFIDPSDVEEGAIAPGLRTRSTNYSANLGLNRLLSTRWTVGVLATARRQNPDTDFFGGTTSGNLSLTTRYQFTEYWSVNGRVGAIYIDSDFVSRTAISGGAGLSYDFERLRVRLNAARDFQPSINGTLRDTLSGSMEVNYDVTKRVTVSAGGRYRESSLEGAADQDLTLYSLFSSANWRFAKNLELNLRYTFSDQELRQTSGSSHRVGISLTFSYPPQGLSK
ncbi:MAG: hypothetical protein AAF862_02540 [Pseudomonadota bacterium]